ncbi:MAG: 2-hydroxyacyl-CoA dehydratase family protein [Dehalococcoidia bacterium]|nr:2-hydroxyacyl-CoA dehydratase family protein [Dehalococcoidia bacterium]
MIDKYLELCGYKPEEIKSQLPRVEKAFTILGLTDFDVERGQERISGFFDTNLRGVRRILGVLVRELVDLTLAKEEGGRWIYSSPPSACADILTAASLGNKDIHVAFPDLLFVLTMGMMFDKLDPIIEAAEGLYLEPGMAHCSLIQTRLGLYARNLIPRAVLQVSVGLICDENPKADASFEEFFGVPVQYLLRSQDKDWEESGRIQRHIDFLAKNLKRMVERVGEAAGGEITDDMLNQARKMARDFSKPMRQILEMGVNCDPPPISSAFVHLMRAINGMPLNRHNHEIAVEGANILCQELQERVNKGEGVVPKGSPRVLHGYVQSYVDPGIVVALEKMGISAPIEEVQLYEPDGRFSPDISGIEDPNYRLAAVLTQASIFNSLPVKSRVTIEACRRYKLDGCLWLVHYSCRPIMSDSYMMKDIVQKELGIPFMVLETDVYDPRYNRNRQLRPQLEAFAEMVKSYKASLR